MYQCELCGREFKGKSGLTNHRKSCEPTEEEVAKEVVSSEVVEEKKFDDNTRRKLEKLKDARKSTWDAQARYEIDLKIAELSGK